MRLSALYISLNTFGSNKDRYTGTASFENDSGKIELNLDPVLSKAILKICARQVVEAAKTVATRMTVEAIEASQEQGQLPLNG